MHETVHEIFCQNCRSSIPVTHTFYFQPATHDEWDALAFFAAAAGAPAVCRECAHENSTDLPVTVYHRELNRMYHYMPASCTAAIDLTRLFEFGGDPSQALLDVVFKHLLDTGAFPMDIVERRSRGGPFNFRIPFTFRVFFSLSEVVQQAFAGARVVEAHRAEAQNHDRIRQVFKEIHKFLRNIGLRTSESNLYGHYAPPPSRILPGSADKKAHQISCKNCRSSVSITHTFYFEPTTSNEWEALASFAAGAGTPAACPECAHENSTDLPVSIYDRHLNRMYHYMPASGIAEMDLKELFETRGDPSPALVKAVFKHLRDAGALQSEVIGYRLMDKSFNLRVFFSASEAIQQAFAGARIADAHRAKAQKYKTIEPPAEFLLRGSRMYKRNKLRFIYRLGQAFEEGRTYSKGDVDSVIRHERQYLRDHPVDDSHARVALIELGLLERTSCGIFYWRKPEASRICGLNFPSAVEGFEKQGYLFYEEPNMGFSVGYRSQALETGVTFYVYGDPDLEKNAEAVEKEFSNTKHAMLVHFESEGRTAEIVDEKRITVDKHNGRAETVCHLTLRLTDPDSSAYRSHFLLTSLGGRFIKVRMTSPDAIANDEEILSRLVSALFKRIASPAAPAVSAVE
jgi:hypothetical protein